MNDIAGQRESLECWAQFSPCHPGLCARREWPDLLGLLNVLDKVTSCEIFSLAQSIVALGLKITLRIQSIFVCTSFNVTIK